MGRQQDRMCFILCAIIPLLLGRLIAASTGSARNSSPSGATAGPTSIVPMLTPEALPRECYFYDSEDGRNRTCPLRNEGDSCYSFIRRITGTGGFRVKRGCSVDCQEERRNRKIQICCRSRLCNTHTLTSENFTSHETTPPHTTPVFTTTTRTGPQSETTTSAPSATIIPPKIIPDSVTESDEDGERGSSVTPEQMPRLLTCNCNQCGAGQLTCEGIQCISTWEVLSDGSQQFSHFCANFTDCPVRVLCCNANYCNGVQSPTEASSTSNGGGGRGGIDLDDGKGQSTTDSGHATYASDSSDGEQPVQGIDDQYFTIATVISVVGGAIIIASVIIILVVVVVYHWRHSKRTTPASNSAPPIFRIRNRIALKPSPSPSFSLTSTESNSGSSNSSGSKSNFNPSIPDFSGDDNPLKYLGTRV